MGPLLLPIEDWDTISHLVLDRKVLQLGFADGRDTVSLARSAHSVTVAGTVTDDGVEATTAHLGQLYRALWDGNCDRHVVIHSADWREATATYCPDQFDLAVIQPAQLGGGLLDEILTTAQAYAKDLLLINRPNADSWEAVTRHCQRPHWSVTASGHCTVARRIFPGPADIEVPS